MKENKNNHIIINFKNMTKTRFFLSIVMLILLCGTMSLQAQQTTTTAGGEASGSGGTASYTVGQTVYTTNTDTSGNSTAQGVQQPYEISTTIGINETSISLEMSVYPNPTTNYLSLKVKKTDNLSYQLYDMQGKLIKDIIISSKTTNIAMETLPSATYLLKVIQYNKLVKTFKIIKNN